ncbi:hypothetical protein TRFO_08516 [Tritrichomonas foetus]|uniref:Serine/threonine-protein phosphatase 4 regulatory subunit 3-like central domain-containing protein n=1 Tax=Tritrichomonas foetus TaxID=1144522 RepID=A0A1J4JJC3_9EUKA|nr:hypothetical protein TRFO_08516 [Tritrichomonas foetus]|eukprot:OHS99262.1 hypothetical protein TRFO_08516 [Tritrichomonas foetus]
MIADYKGITQLDNRLFSTLQSRNDNLEQTAFEDTEMSSYFPELQKLFTTAVEFFHQHDQINLSETVSQINSFFTKHEELITTKNVDLSSIIHFYKETQFDRMIYEAFQIDEPVLIEIFIPHIFVILPFPQMGQIFSENEFFTPICLRFFSYEGQKVRQMILCLIHLFIYQDQYESTFLTIFENYEYFVSKILRIMESPIYLLHFIHQVVYSKNPFQNKVVGQYHIILQHLPIVTEEPNCLAALYRICKKMIKNANNQIDIFNPLDKMGFLDVLLACPENDSDLLKKLRIDFLRILISKLEKKNDLKYIISKHFSFDFETVVQCIDSDNSELVIPALKLLNSFIPKLSDELFKLYQTSTLISFISSILGKGQFLEKKLAVKLMISIITNGCSKLFIRDLLKKDNFYDDFECEDEEKNNQKTDIFVSICDMLQIGQDDLTIQVLQMLQVICNILNNPYKRDLRQMFEEKIYDSEIRNEIDELMNSENPEICELASDISTKMLNFFTMM